jgi:DNA-binding NarL/FixJ family response regulator
VTVRVVLVDDQALIRAGFKAIVDSAPDLEVVGECDDGETALDVIRKQRADVVLMDVRMPGRDGIATTQSITDDDDLAGVRVIVLTTFELDEYVVDAMRAGASGFLDKGVDPDVLLDAIRVVAGGEALLTPKATRALLASMTDEPAPAVVDEDAIRHRTGREDVGGCTGRAWGSITVEVDA